MFDFVLNSLIKNKNRFSTDFPSENRCVSINFLTLKGGVGKTTLATELSQFLSKKNARVLAVDLDPQSNFSLSLSEMDFDSIENLKCFYDVIYNNIPVQSAIIKTKFNIDLLPSTGINSLINQSQDPRLITKSRQILSELKKNYDYIIYDSNPTASVSHAISVLNSDYIFSPILIDLFSVQGLKKTMSDVKDICRQFNHRIQHKIIFNKIGSDPLIAERAEQIRNILPPNSWLASLSTWDLESLDTKVKNQELENIYNFIKLENKIQKGL